jgi:1-aminocyclopropane-1-carboxylate deaminase/D-cysteine desulfhydrase-like pyridoxal-dependent ACC family enzyme
MAAVSIKHPAIFEEYPSLRDALPWAPLGDFPTPLEASAEAAKLLGAGNCLVKRDDLSSPVYGGNKVRKLEFLVADAQRKGARSLITFGGIGSNHLLATSIHGGRLGFHTTGCVVKQPLTAHVKENLLLNLHYGTELVYSPSEPALPAVALGTFLRKWAEDKEQPYVITIGGSSVLGTVGYVSAAFELKRQLTELDLPEPDVIFAPLGSSGTASGLILGCRAAGLRTRIVPVCVSNQMYNNKYTATLLCRGVNSLLRRHAPEFPDCDIRPGDVHVVYDQLGPAYGALTPQCVEAVKAARAALGLKLEGVYTGKTFAGMMDYCRRNDVSKKTVLFWFTYNSVDLSRFAEQENPGKLPSEIRRLYFKPNQPLDAECHC